MALMFASDVEKGYLNDCEACMCNCNKEDNDNDDVYKHIPKID